MKIVTEHVYPPIPMRQFDWVAHYDDPEGLAGWGRTEAEAIADLKAREVEASDAGWLIRHGKVPDRETWWLVERKVQPPQYCIQKHSDMPSLTADPWRAARFATEREAFDYRLRLSSLRDECKETEHVIINKV